MASAMAALIAPVALATPNDGAAPTAAQTMRVDVSGALARVTVTRTLSCAPTWADPRTDQILDLALPDRARLLTVDVSARGRTLPTRPTTMAAARDAYLESLRGSDIAAARAPFEDETRIRIRAACLDSNAHDVIVMKYSFSTPLEIRDGAARIAFPASAELTPPATRVELHVAPPIAGARTISIAGATERLGPGGASIAARPVSTRARWTIAIGLLQGRDSDGRSTGIAVGAIHSRVAALASIATATATATTASATATTAAAGATSSAGRARKGPLVAYAVGLAPGTPQALPDRVLFLVDRSRSVGASGLEAERDVARRILDALAPSTRFDALFFDRGQKRLFPAPRAATREAIARFDDEMVSERLANGTDLMAAARAAGDLLRREASELGPRALLVILSDGAVGGSVSRDAPTGARSVADALGPSPGVDLMTAAISVRPNDDAPVSDDDRRALRDLAAAASLGGVERTIRTGEIDDAVPALLDTLRAGGEITSVRIGGTAGAANAAPVAVADAIAPGGGASGVVAAVAALPLALTFRARGRLQQLTIHPARADARWFPAPETNAGASTPQADAAWSSPARLLVGPPVAVLVEPVSRPREVTTAAPDGPRGYLERSVVRDALSLAFTPRARACYLNRTARTQADRDLSGRVRLALDLVRGEVGAARIEASTLSHPTIENCLREAAFALDVPRAYRNDTPVTAILNLVFRPRTPERKTEIENAVFDRQIDLLVDAALKEARAPDTGSEPDPATPDDAPAPSAPASEPAAVAAPASER